MSSAERRARREARRRKRKQGQRFILAGYVVVGLAVLVAAVGLVDLPGGGGDDVATDEPPSPFTTRRGQVATTTTEPDVVVDLVPETIVSSEGGGNGGGVGGGAGLGGQGAGVNNDSIVVGNTFGVRTPTYGIVQVAAAPRASRPRPNAAPTVSAPAAVDRQADGSAVVSGITIEDPDYPGAGEIGILLVVDGSITVTLNQEVQLLAPNSAAFVALAGPPEALNRALADLRVRTEGPAELIITVTDWGYGDLPRAGGGAATVTLR